jgi:hypothetical protein
VRPLGQRVQRIRIFSGSKRAHDEPRHARDLIDLWRREKLIVGEMIGLMLLVLKELGRRLRGIARSAILVKAADGSATVWGGAKAKHLVEYTSICAAYALRFFRTVRMTSRRIGWHRHAERSEASRHRTSRCFASLRIRSGRLSSLALCSRYGRRMENREWYAAFGSGYCAPSSFS